MNSDASQPTTVADNAPSEAAYRGLLSSVLASAESKPPSAPLPPAPKPKPKGPKWFAYVLPVLAGWLIWITPVGNWLAEASYDLLFPLKPAVTPTEVHIVYM